MDDYIVIEVSKSEGDDEKLSETFKINKVLTNYQNQSDLVIMELLRKLQGMSLNMLILQATQIGRRVNALRKHESREIRHLARALIMQWRAMVDECVEAQVKKSGDKKNENSNGDCGSLPKANDPFIAFQRHLLQEDFFNGVGASVSATDPSVDVLKISKDVDEKEFSGILPPDDAKASGPLSFPAEDIFYKPECALSMEKKQEKNPPESTETELKGNPESPNLKQTEFLTQTTAKRAVDIIHSEPKRISFCTNKRDEPTQVAAKGGLKVKESNAVHSEPKRVSFFIEKRDEPTQVAAKGALKAKESNAVYSEQKRLSFCADKRDELAHSTVKGASKAKESNVVYSGQKRNSFCADKRDEHVQITTEGALKANERSAVYSVPKHISFWTDKRAEAAQVAKGALKAKKNNVVYSEPKPVSFCTDKRDRPTQSGPSGEHVQTTTIVYGLKAITSQTSNSAKPSKAGDIGEAKLEEAGSKLKAGYHNYETSRKRRSVQLIDPRDLKGGGKKKRHKW